MNPIGCSVLQSVKASKLFVENYIFDDIQHLCIGMLFGNTP